MDILHTHSIPNGKENMANALTYRLSKKDLAISNTCSNTNKLKGETANYACTYIHMYKMPLITWLTDSCPIMDPDDHVIGTNDTTFKQSNCGSPTGWTHRQNELHIQYLGHYAYTVMSISTRVRCAQDKHITKVRRKSCIHTPYQCLQLVHAFSLAGRVIALLSRNQGYHRWWVFLVQLAC